MVQGAVGKPGVYRFRGETSLLQLITMAGGLTQGHGAFVYLFRAIRNQSELMLDGESYVYVPGLPTTQKQNRDGADGVRYDLLRVHTNGILGDQFSQPLTFPSGSTVNVPIGEVFFVTGDVQIPGSFRYQVGMTLRQAIFLAHIERIETASYAAIYRVNPETCIEREMVVGLDALVNGDGNDIDLRPDDIINIHNRNRSFEPLIRLSHLLNPLHD
jgi:protein involved in polysaccharide export with SLBB domain